MNGKGDTYRPSPNFSTNFKKVKMVNNFPYRRYIREMRCLICNRLDTDPHHVRTRGAGGRDEANLVPLCRTHHTELHTIGRLTFEDKYKTGCLQMRAEQIWEGYEQAQADI